MTLIRKKLKGKAQEYCSETSQEGDILITGPAFYKLNGLPWNGSYFLGVFGKLIFLEAADAFGDLRAFSVLDSDTGRKLFEDIYHVRRGFEIKAGTNTELIYFRYLKADCTPVRDPSACWQKILTENKISSTPRIKPPDCQSEFRRKKTSEDDLALIAAKVSVTDIVGDTKFSYIPEPVLCYPSP